LIDHAGLDKVSFTGSGVAGQKMLEASASKLRPTSLELGGKSALIVFDDMEAHLDAVVDWVMVGIFSCTGQVCSATSRLLVQEDVAPRLLEKLHTAMDKICVGDPLADGTQMGPAVSAEQQSKILAAVDSARAEGYSVHSSPVSLDSSLSGGFYVPPTIITDMPEDSSVWREEIFGPVLSVKTFKTEDEALTLANDTVYGLSNAVFSADPSRCSRVSTKLESGVVWENCSQALWPATPFGGKPGKASGFGHEMGPSGLEEYISSKTVVSAEAGFSWGVYAN
jgi:betaine-aldehyde dehydrogenase